MDPFISRELAKLDPDVPFRATSSHLYHTWAKTWYSRPELFFQPESIEEIQKIVTCARRCRRRIVVVGSGHSPSDLTCTSSWLVNLDNFNRMLSIDTESRVATFQAGLRLRDLCAELESRGLTVPNLGSINEQSVAGAISTGTHGSSLRYDLLSSSISAMKLVLSNGQVVSCSSTTNPNLFRAALVSLGALGIIVEITFQAVPDFRIEWTQTLQPLSHILSTWNTTLWDSAEFTRVWWVPYNDTAVVWRADKTTKALSPPPKSYYGGKLGFHTYQFLLHLARYIPSINPWVEWFIFGMQYGFRPGPSTTCSAVQHGREGLLMDCLFSQYVNEWAVPLSKGPEAITRLRSFLHDPDYHSATSNIPYSSKKLYIHSPIEVRVTTSIPSQISPNANANDHTRPYLSPTSKTEPTLYLNAIMYRPYLRDPPCMERYYQAFEHLMRDLGGRPHWAKNFTGDTSDSGYLEESYGEDLKAWKKIRDEVDPVGMWVGEWHKRNLGVGVGVSGHDASEDRNVEKANDELLMVEEETETSGKRFGKAKYWGDGLLWSGRIKGGGRRQDDADKDEGSDDKEKTKVVSLSDSMMTVTDASGTPSPPMTATSDESFDYMAKGEASVMLGKEQQT